MVTIITGTIKANFPSRVAFRVSSMVNSRTILDVNGAEKLLGRGDMLFHPAGMPKPERLQGCYVTQEEIRKIVDYWKSCCSTTYLLEGIGDEKDPFPVENEKSTDGIFEEAVRLVRSTGSASTSLLQRRLSIGYGRAARILDQMEEARIVGPSRGSKAREVLNTNLRTEN